MRKNIPEMRYKKAMRCQKLLYFTGTIIKINLMHACTSVLHVKM